jgi:DUF4097 and DUF4098 domain-containing protein YvlB
MKNISLSFFLILFTIISCEGVSVNKSISIADGETVNNDLTSVNGNIDIGENCNIRGDCSTVNGKIRIGRNSKVADVQSVNGSILLSENVSVNDDVNSVNGSIDCKRGVKIRGEINTVNGNVELFNSEIGRDITSINGNVKLMQKSIVGGDIRIKGKDRSSSKHRTVKIHLLDNSVVEGDIIGVQGVYVEVFVENGSKVKGRIINAEIVDE